MKTNYSSSIICSYVIKPTVTCTVVYVGHPYQTSSSFDMKRSFIHTSRPLKIDFKCKD